MIYWIKKSAFYFSALKQKQLTNQTTDEAVASIDRDVSSDKDGSNALKPIFDRKEIEAGFEITEAFVRNVGTHISRAVEIKFMYLKFYYVNPGFNDRGERVLFWQGSFEGDKAKKERYERYICNTLPAIAQTVKECMQLLNYMDMAERGEGEYETGGNDVTLTITKAGVQVDIEINEDWIGQEEGFFSLADWRAAVTGWQKFIKMDRDLKTFVNVQL